MNYEICYNCGADYGLHQSKTFHCPKNGIEETRNGKKQQWQETVFEDITVKKTELAASDLLKIANELNRLKYYITIESDFSYDWQKLLENNEYVIKKTTE